MNGGLGGKGVAFYYKRVREGIPTIYQGSMYALEDPELTEMTEEEYNAEIEALAASLPQPEPTDDATEEDFIEALNDLGVIP